MQCIFSYIIILTYESEIYIFYFVKIDVATLSVSLLGFDYRKTYFGVF